MMTHLFACFRGVVHRYDAVDPAADLDGFTAYMRALWWSVTALTTLGTIPTAPSIPQLSFSIIVLVGSFITAVYIIGNMGVLISNLDASAVRPYHC